MYITTSVHRRRCVYVCVTAKDFILNVFKGLIAVVRSRRVNILYRLYRLSNVRLFEKLVKTVSDLTEHRTRSVVIFYERNSK